MRRRLVAAYITFEAPISGMSMNPARYFGFGNCRELMDGLWVYFTAPLIGMLAAAEVYIRSRGSHDVACAKLHHDNCQTLHLLRQTGSLKD